MFEAEAKEYKLNLLSELIEKIQQGYNCKELLDIELAFQKGAEFGYNKANEWHDLRKNPNDLPKEFDRIKKAFGIYPEEKYIHIVLNQDGEYVHYLSGDWYYIYDEDVVGDSRKVDVIAWCELPKFEVEE